MQRSFGGTWAGRRVLVTGHTGFPGAWLSAWLLDLGAEVVGLSLGGAPSDPSCFSLARLGTRLTHLEADVRDRAAVVGLVREHTPDAVFHLASLPVTRNGFQDPASTFETNVMGTVNMLEAVRVVDSVRAMVCLTTDKVYRNEAWVWGSRESDGLGGWDPFSASKRMSQTAIGSYTASFFPPAQYDTHGVAVATASAGNLIGGGDFSPNRLLPDCVRHVVEGRAVGLRRPGSVRAWQHVLEPLAASLWLGAHLLEHGSRFSRAFDVGPVSTEPVTAQQITEHFLEGWGGGTWTHAQPWEQGLEPEVAPRVAQLDPELGWQPIWRWPRAVDEVVAFTKAWQAGDDVYQVMLRHLRGYTEDASLAHQPWALRR